MIYPILTLSRGKLKYFSLKIPLASKKIIAQIRLMCTYYERLILNNKKYKFSDSQCNYCIDRNSIYHMIVCCQRYNQERKELICNVENESDNTTYPLLTELNNPTIENVKKLCNFLKVILES